MYDYYTHLVWIVDIWFLSFAILLSVLVFIYASAKRKGIVKKYTGLMDTISKLQATMLSEKGPAINGCIDLMKKTASFEFLDIARHKEDIVPKERFGDFTKCIIGSGRIGETEKSARRSWNKWRRIESIISIGHLKTPHALEILSTGLRDRDENIRYFSMLSLGYIKTPESAQILLDIVRKRIFSGAKVAAVLENFPPEITDVLIKNTEDKDSVLRAWALKIISKFKPGQYVAKIAVFAEDDDSGVRAAACDCLGEIKDKNTSGTVKKCLTDNAWRVRVSAVVALEKISGPGSIPDIVVRMNDTNTFVREVAKEAIKKHVDIAAPYLEKLIERAVPDIKRECVEIFEASGYLNRVLHNAASGDTERGKEALRLLELMIRAEVYFNFEGVLMNYTAEMRRKVLDMVASVHKKVFT